MEQRINFITLGVDNLEMMKKFYHEIFGWEYLKDDQGIVFFQLNGLILGLFPISDLAEEIGVDENRNGFSGFSLSINFNSKLEVDMVYSDLLNKGARGIKAPNDIFWGGYNAYIADPENNYWELAFNPFLAMDEKGNSVSHP